MPCVQISAQGTWVQGLGKHHRTPSSPRALPPPISHQDHGWSGPLISSTCHVWGCARAQRSPSSEYRLQHATCLGSLVSTHLAQHLLHATPPPPHSHPPCPCAPASVGHAHGQLGPGRAVIHAQCLVVQGYLVALAWSGGPPKYQPCVPPQEGRPGGRMHMHARDHHTAPTASKESKGILAMGTDLCAQQQRMRCTNDQAGPCMLHQRSRPDPACFTCDHASPCFTSDQAGTLHASLLKQGGANRLGSRECSAGPTLGSVLGLEQASQDGLCPSPIDPSSLASSTP